MNCLQCAFLGAMIAYTPALIVLAIILARATEGPRG